VLAIGEKVRAKIIGIEGDKVSLSLKALKEDPWLGIEERYHKGDIVTGVVVKFNPFGAFVKLEDRIQGLAHISEFGSEAKMAELLELGQPHRFQVLAVDARERRLALGLPDRQAGLPDRQAGLVKEEGGAAPEPTIAPEPTVAPEPSAAPPPVEPQGTPGS
jgi:ribosomal protein S1